MSRNVRVPRRVGARRRRSRCRPPKWCGWCGPGTPRPPTARPDRRHPGWRPARCPAPWPRAAPRWRAGPPPARRVGLPCQQRDFEIERIVVVGADDRLRIGDTGRGQSVRRLHVTTRAPALFSSSTIRIPSASSPQTMMWPLMCENATAEKPAAKGEDGSDARSAPRSTSRRASTAPAPRTSTRTCR